MADLEDTIAEVAAGPKRMKGDEGEVEAHSLGDLIEADEYLARKSAQSKGLKAMRVSKAVPPGAV